MPKFQPDSTLREMQWLLPRGPWYARKSMVVKDPEHPTGQRRVWRSESTRLRNKTLARKEVLRILGEWDGKGVSAGEIELFREGSAHYKKTRQNRASETKAQIENCVDKHLDPFFGPMRLGAITLAHWESFVAHRRALAPDCALFNNWKTFTGIMRLAHEEGHVKRRLRVPNPDEDRELPELVYSDEEIHALLKHANPTSALQIVMATDLFMRRGEILGLTWDRVDFKLGRDAAGEPIYGKITLLKRTTKIRRKREFPMTGEIWRLLQERKVVQDRRFSREYGRRSPCVFPTRGDCEKPTRDNGHAFDRIKRDAGIVGKKTFHTLRHSALSKAFARAQAEASLVGRNEISIGAVKICLVAGLSLQMAMDRYLHIRPDQMGDVISMSWGMGKRLLLSDVGNSGQSPAMAVVAQ